MWISALRINRASNECSHLVSVPVEQKTIVVRVRVISRSGTLALNAPTRAEERGETVFVFFCVWFFHGRKNSTITHIRGASLKTNTAENEEGPLHAAPLPESSEVGEIVQGWVGSLIPHNLSASPSHNHS